MLPPCSSPCQVTTLAAKNAELQQKVESLTRQLADSTARQEEGAGSAASVQRQLDAARAELATALAELAAARQETSEVALQAAAAIAAATAAQAQTRYTGVGAAGEGLGGGGLNMSTLAGAVGFQGTAAAGTAAAPKPALSSGFPAGLLGTGGSSGSGSSSSGGGLDSLYSHFGGSSLFASGLMEGTPTAVAAGPLPGSGSSAGSSLDFGVTVQLPASSPATFPGSGLTINGLSHSSPSGSQPGALSSSPMAADLLLPRELQHAAGSSFGGAAQGMGSASGQLPMGWPGAGLAPTSLPSVIW